MNKTIKAVVTVLSPPESEKTISLELVVKDDSPASEKVISLDLKPMLITPTCRRSSNVGHPGASTWEFGGIFGGTTEKPAFENVNKPER